MSSETPSIRLVKVWSGQDPVLRWVQKCVASKGSDCTSSTVAFEIDDLPGTLSCQPIGGGMSLLQNVGVDTIAFVGTYHAGQVQLALHPVLPSGRVNPRDAHQIYTEITEQLEGRNAPPPVMFRQNHDPENLARLRLWLTDYLHWLHAVGITHRDSGHLLAPWISSRAGDANCTLNFSLAGDHAPLGAKKSPASHFVDSLTTSPLHTILERYETVVPVGPKSQHPPMTVTRFFFHKSESTPSQHRMLELFDVFGTHLPEV